MNRKSAIIGCCTLLGFLMACDDSTGPGSLGNGVSLSFATLAPGAAPQPRVAGTGWGALTVGGQLEITSAEIVLREVELKRIDVADCDVVLEPEGCYEFEVGPTLVSLPLNGGTAHQVAISIDPGTYDEVEFEIHKVSKDGQEDAGFRAAHPAFTERSIRVQGSYDGQPFTYETDLDVEQEFHLMPPLLVDAATTSTNVTIRVDLAAWFVDGSGAVVNPAEANQGGQYESLVKENIKQSIEAFEDQDRDGDDQDES